MISNNDRISVSHDDTRAKFRLHINNVTLEDAGPYMCQINSMPVKLQVGHGFFFYSIVLCWFGWKKIWLLFLTNTSFYYSFSFV